MDVSQWLETATKEEIDDIIEAVHNVNGNTARWNPATCLKRLMSYPIKDLYPYLKNERTKELLFDPAWYAHRDTRAMVCKHAPIHLVERFTKEFLLTMSKNGRLIKVIEILKNQPSFERVAIITSLYDPELNLFINNSFVLSQYLPSAMLATVARVYPKMISCLSHYVMMSNVELFDIMFSLLPTDAPKILSGFEPIKDLRIAMKAVKCNPRCLPYLDASIQSQIFEEIGYDVMSEAAIKCIERSTQGMWKGECHG
jgi:hypothetical protein